MDIKNKLAQDQDELEEFLVFNLMGRKSITAIVEYETLISILDNIEQYIDESVDKYKCRIVDDELYVITKEEYDGYVDLEVKSLFFYNDEEDQYDIEYIESDVVYIEDMEYNTSDFQEDLEDSICSDEVFNLCIDEEDELEDDNNQPKCYQCENCSCYCDDTKDNDNNEEDEIDECAEDFLTQILQDYYNDEIEELEDLLKIVYSVAFDLGKEEILLSMRESIDVALEN